jgi:hypothetical protein
VHDRQNLISIPQAAHNRSKKRKHVYWDNADRDETSPAESPKRTKAAKTKMKQPRLFEMSDQEEGNETTAHMENDSQQAVTTNAEEIIAYSGTTEDPNVMTESTADGATDDYLMDWEGPEDDMRPWQASTSMTQLCRQSSSVLRMERTTFRSIAQWVAVRIWFL